MALQSQRSALREDAVRLLDELGASVGEVACSLYLLGAARAGSNSVDPPATRYLHAVVGADSRVQTMTVTKRWLVIRTQRRWRSTIRVRLPRPVRDFTSAVDRVSNREATGYQLEGGEA